MIAREHCPAYSLAGRVGAAEGAAGSSLARGGVESNKRAGMIFSEVFDIEGLTRVAAHVESGTLWKGYF